MSSQRNAIIERLRALDQQTPGGGQPGSLPPLARTEEGDGVSPAACLAAALERVDTTWEIAESPVSARLQLVTTLQASETKAVLSWRADCLPVPGLLDTLAVLGIEVTTPDLRAAPRRVRPQDPDSRNDLLRAISKIETGIVAADAATTDTGTLILRSGPGRPLLAAYQVRRVLVLLPASHIYPSLARWHRHQRTSEDAALLTFLTGPSQSYDLELILAAGIHGPRQVHVMIVEGI